MKGEATSGQVLLIGVMCLVTGLAILAIPTSQLLKMDRSTGYQIFKRAPDPYTGQRMAGAFYVFLGLVFTLVGAGAIVASLLDILAQRGP